MSFEYKNITSFDEATELDLKIYNAIKNRRLQSLGKVAVDVIIDRLNLELFYELLVSFNTSNNLPYHNFYHAECVFLNCYEGALLSNLEEDEIRGLCVAALFHDFNHSGGNLTDDKNITEAIKGLEIAQKYASSAHLGLNKLSLETAINAIKITEYPYVKEPSTVPEQIIRDADLMQIYEEDRRTLLKQYLGLKAELELKSYKMTCVDFAGGIKHFYNKIQWNTQWAINKAYVRSIEAAKADLLILIINT